MRDSERADGMDGAGIDSDAGAAAGRPPPLHGLGHADRAALARLFYDYAWYFDRNDPEGAAGLFTEDAVVDYGPEMPTLRTREEIFRGVQRGLRTLFAAASHHLSNIRLRADGGGGAEGTAYVYAQVSYRSGAPDARLWGQYHCRFRRTGAGGGWRIAEMVLKAAGAENFHRDSLHSIGRRP